MTLVLRHNESLELNWVEYRGSVTHGELVALAEYQAANPAWLTYDCLNCIMADADFASVDLADLDQIFQRYRALFEPLNLVIFRRSAWICHSAASEEHLRYWMGDRDTRGGMSSDLRRFDSISEACHWLVLNPTQTASVERGEGFKEIIRFTEPARLTGAAR